MHKAKHLFVGALCNKC